MPISRSVLLAAGVAAGFLLQAPGAGAGTLLLAQAAADCSEAKAHFDISHEIDTPEAYQAHIDAFGNCPYADFARILKAKAEARAGAAAAAPATPAAPSAADAAAKALDALRAAKPATPNPPPAAPSPDEAAQALAQRFVERLDALAAEAGPKPPKISFDSARSEGADVVMSGLVIEQTGEGQKPQRLIFARATLKNPQSAADGTLTADALQLSQGVDVEPTAGGSWPDDPYGTTEKSALIGSVEVDGLVLGAPGAAAAADRIGPASFTSASLSDLTAYENGEPIFNLDRSQVQLGDVTGGVPSKFGFSLQGLTFTPEQLAKASDSELEAVKSFGYDSFVFDMGLNLSRDPAPQTLSIDNAAFGMRGAGEIAFTALLGHVDAAQMRQAAENPVAALMALPVDLRSAELRYTDQSLTEKVITAAAKSENIDRPLFAAAIPTVVGSALEQATGSKSFAEAVKAEAGAFVAAPKSIRLSVRPPQSLALTSLAMTAMGGAQPAVLMPLLSPSLSVNDRPAVPFVIGSAGPAAGLGGTATPRQAAENMMRGLLGGDADAEAIIVTDEAKDLDVSVRRAIQDYLRDGGYFSGRSDGVLGSATQAAIAAWRNGKGA